MNLLRDPWIPVRDEDGSGCFRLLTYRELLCQRGKWRVSLPRDDLELACIQLLICMTQVMFQPEDDDELEEWHDAPLNEKDFDAGVASYLDWFDLNHPMYPFMQARSVSAKEVTPIQKLLIGLPEGNNHCFFNEVGEIGRLSGPAAAIALFHQASNCPSFGGGFKGGLRGGAPITTLVDGPGLREQVWRNVLTRGRIEKDLPWTRDLLDNRPTWVDPIKAGEAVYPNQVGVLRGLFWQPGRVELIEGTGDGACDLLGIDAGPCYSGLRKEKFNFRFDGTWPHPHGALQVSVKKGKREAKFASFTTSAPAWTRLAEMVVRRSPETGEGNRPAPAIGQAQALDIVPLRLLIGGYRNKQASVLERRHELTEPYAMKPELIPIIAWARRSLTADLKKLKEGK